MISNRKILEIHEVLSSVHYNFVVDVKPLPPVDYGRELPPTYNIKNKEKYITRFIASINSGSLGMSASFGIGGSLLLYCGIPMSVPLVAGLTAFGGLCSLPFYRRECRRHIKNHAAMIKEIKEKEEKLNELKNIHQQKQLTYLGRLILHYQTYLNIKEKQSLKNLKPLKPITEVLPSTITDVTLNSFSQLIFASPFKNKIFKETSSLDAILELIKNLYTRIKAHQASASVSAIRDQKDIDLNEMNRFFLQHNDECISIFLDEGLDSTERKYTLGENILYLTNSILDMMADSANSLGVTSTFSAFSVGSQAEWPSIVAWTSALVIAFGLRKTAEINNKIAHQRSNLLKTLDKEIAHTQLQIMKLSHEIENLYGLRSDFVHHMDMLLSDSTVKIINSLEEDKQYTLKQVEHSEFKVQQLESELKKANEIQDTLKQELALAKKDLTSKRIHFFKSRNNDEFKSTQLQTRMGEDRVLHRSSTDFIISIPTSPI